LFSVPFTDLPILSRNSIRVNRSAIAAAYILWRLAPVNILPPPLGGDPLSLDLVLPLDGSVGSLALPKKFPL
jgi:hypothetical protein